jgi:hypothetical protein
LGLTVSLSDPSWSLSEPPLFLSDPPLSLSESPLFLSDPSFQSKGDIVFMGVFANVYIGSKFSGTLEIKSNITGKKQTPKTR